MKNLLKIVALSGFAFVLSSCGTANDVYGNNNSNNYPTNNRGVYRVPDGTVYGQNDIFRDRNGNVYQNGRIIRTGDISGQPGVLGRNGNNNQVFYPNNNARRLPPGQAKKIYGGNAKDYARGQMKKRDGDWNNDRQRRDDEGDRRYRKDDDHKYENRNGKEYKKRFKSKDRDRDNNDD